MRHFLLLLVLLAGVALAQTPADLGSDGGADGGGEVPGTRIPEKKSSRFDFGCSFTR